MACEHNEVGRADYVKGEPFWKCDKCNAEFVLKRDMDSQVEEMTDLTVAIASAMLWDMHERAVEKYGKEVAAPIRPQTAMFEFLPEDCPEHEYQSGQCIHCGGSQFLGAS